jgi:hypothetical protein
MKRKSQWTATVTEMTLFFCGLLVILDMRFQLIKKANQSEISVQIINLFGRVQ